MSTKYIIASMFVMALTTYVIRMLPMAIFRKKINDKRVQSFLYYVPYAVLSAMTFPAIFSSTGSEVSAVVGCVKSSSFASSGVIRLCGGDCAGVYETGIAYCGCRSCGGGFSCTDDWILKTSGMDFSENNGEIYPGSFMFKR